MFAVGAARSDVQPKFRLWAEHLSDLLELGGEGTVGIRKRAKTHYAALQKFKPIVFLGKTDSVFGFATTRFERLIRFHLACDKGPA